MSTTSATPLSATPADEDLAEQAHAGHGVPSQDTAAGAQFPLESQEAAREAKSVLVGGGVVAGGATGATIGAMVAGPLGVIVGGTLGTVVGALGAVVAGTVMTPDDSSSTNTAPVDAVRMRAEDSGGGSQTTAQVHQLIGASAPAIWTALTTPAALKQFFFDADVVSDWKVGSPIRIQGEFEGRTYEDKGRIVTFDPPRQLSFSHWSALSGEDDAPENYRLVTFDLEPSGAATTVTLSQANLVGGVTASDIEQRAAYEKKWASVLEGLAKALVGRPSPSPEVGTATIRHRESMPS